jgi:hypothetical protein
VEKMKVTVWALPLLLLAVSVRGQNISDRPSHGSETLFEVQPASPNDPTPPIAGEKSATAVSKHKEGFHWGTALLQQMEFTAIQHAGNLGMDKWKRYYLGNGPFWSNYEKSVAAVRWSVWNDNDPFLDDYIAHPMQGAIYGYIQIQNDPEGRDLQLEKSRRYVVSRLRAFAWSVVWSAQWKVGPLSEASIGNTGLYKYYSTASHGITNGTGMVDYVMTPVGGMAWLVGEDAIDKYVVQPITANHRQVPLLLAISILTPCRSATNILRFRSPWYRDKAKELATAKQLPSVEKQLNQNENPRPRGASSNRR